MPRVFFNILVVALLMPTAAYGQSLGEVARENRKKPEDAAPAAKVITNADIAKDPNGDQERNSAEKPADAANREASDHRSTERRLAEQRAADRWKRSILAQRNKVTALQARIDQLNASIRSAYGSVQNEGPYNRYQTRQLDRVAQLQQQLDEQQMKLEQMQEDARRAGMHTAVYDP